MKKLIFLLIFYFVMANGYVATYKNVSAHPMKFQIYAPHCPSLKFSKMVYLKPNESIDVEFPSKCSTQTIVDFSWPENKNWHMTDFWPFNPKSLSKNYITINGRPIFFQIV